MRAARIRAVARWALHKQISPSNLGCSAALSIAAPGWNCPAEFCKFAVWVGFEAIGFSLSESVERVNGESMDLYLSGKVAIISGASRGIGRAIAETLAA